MNKKIIQQNILIAEFMGGRPIAKLNAPYKKPTSYFFGEYDAEEEMITINILDLNYHKDWNKLMQVVEEVEKTRMNVSITSDEVGLCGFPSNLKTSQIYKKEILLEFDKRKFTKSQALYTLLIEYIDWHNNN